MPAVKSTEGKYAERACSTCAMADAMRDCIWARVGLESNARSFASSRESLYLAGALAVPASFSCGAGVVTAGVKRGLSDDKHERGIDAEDYFRSKLAANHMCPKGACKLIREQAEVAMRKYLAHREAFGYRAFEAPYRLEREFRTNHARGRHQICRQEASDSQSFIRALNALLSAPLVAMP